MKRVSILTLGVILFGFMSATALPPVDKDWVTVTKASGVRSSVWVEDIDPIAYIGSIGYTDAFQVELGAVFPTPINRLYGYLTLQGGDYGASAGLKAAYLFWLGKGGYFGLTAGQQADWFNDGMTIMGYINSAGGIWGGYSFDKWGIFAQYERIVPDLLEGKGSLEAFNKYKIGVHIDL